MKIIVIFISILLASCTHAADTFDYREYSTLIRVDGKNIWTKCPKWDWLQVPAVCRMAGFNCVPVCGKWPGDKVDIGALQYIPGQTSEKPWGDWKGIPFSYTPGEMAPPQNFRLQRPPPPTDLVIIGVEIDDK